MNEILRKSKNKKLFGVCGGFAEYLKVDPTAIRIATIVISIFSGLGIVTYIAGAILMPDAE